MQEEQKKPERTEEQEIAEALKTEREYHQSSKEEAIENIVISMKKSREKVQEIAEKVYSQ